MYALFCDSFPWHEQDAQFVEEVHREGNDGEGEGIGGGGDDGGNEEDGNDSVAAELLHLMAMQDAEATEKPREDGNLEGDAHGEGKENEGVDVAFEGDKVLDIVRHLVVAEEAESDGEYDEIAEEDTQHEHEVGSNDERCGVASFVFVECGRDEMVELVENVGCCHDEANVEAGHHVDNELASQFCVDELDFGGGAERGDAGGETSCHDTEGEEVGAFRGKNNKENLVFEDKGEDGEECHNDEASDEHSTQFFEMVPESHGNGQFDKLLFTRAFRDVRTLAYLFRLHQWSLPSCRP